MTVIMKAKEVAQKVKDEVRSEVATLKAKGIPVSLAVILVGDDEASKVYVGGKQKDCDYCGIEGKQFNLPKETSQEELLALIDKLNKDETISGILVQLPLPKHLDEEIVIKHISVQKDVDAFHSENVGKIMQGNYDFLPCTPAGVMDLLDYYNIDIEGKDCVVIGRSNIVGKPMAMLLLHKNATVTICHSRTKDIKNFTREADIVVAAVGKAKFLTADMVKTGACIIDVGMNRLEGKLCGDVDYDEVKKVAGAITPVPGGVGLMTRSTLMKNTLTAAKLIHGLNK